jgi:hypothetical protein
MLLSFALRRKSLFKRKYVAAVFFVIISWLGTDLIIGSFVYSVPDDTGDSFNLFVVAMEEYLVAILMATTALCVATVFFIGNSSLEIIIRFLEFIDRRTPDGVVGIIGFALLFLGFLGQFSATWLGRPH